MQQLGDPVLLAPNVRVFDFVRGETVEVTRIDGGNPLLVADNRHVFSARATFRPIGGGGPTPSTNLSITANYTKSRIDNPIASFPVATAEIEAAFRAVRARWQGRLVRAIPGRQYALSDREDLRGASTSSCDHGGSGNGRTPRRGGDSRRTFTLCTGRAAAVRGSGRTRGAAQARRGAGGGMFGPGRRRPAPALPYLRFRYSVLSGPAGPSRLSRRSAFAAGRPPRHELEMTRRGLPHGSAVHERDLAGRQHRARRPERAGRNQRDLPFQTSPLSPTLFADLGQQQGLVRRFGWLKGARVSVSVSNIFDSRLRVRDDSGGTPLNYQGDYLDPLGRAVRIGFRKLF